MRMRRIIQTGLAASPPLPDVLKKRQKQQTVVKRCGLLASVCALSFCTAHLTMLSARHLPFADMRLKTDLGGLVLAALVPALVLAGFAGRRHRWGLVLCFGACAAAALASLLPLS